MYLLVPVMIGIFIGLSFGMIINISYNLFKNRKKRRKIETSKLIILVLFLFSTIFVLYNMYLSYVLQQTNVLEIIADGLFKLFTIAIGFYYWKAKNENMNKWKKKGEIVDENIHYDPYEGH